MSSNSRGPTARGELPSTFRGPLAPGYCSVLYLTAKSELRELPFFTGANQT